MPLIDHWKRNESIHIDFFEEKLTLEQKTNQYWRMFEW